MPRIPRMNLPQTIESPKMSPGAAAAPYGAFAGAGQDIERTGLHASNVFSMLAERERRTEEALKLLKVKSEVQDQLDQNLESYRTRTDSENFDKDMQLEINGTRDTLRPKDLSPEALEAYEAYFETKAIQYRQAVKAKKYDVMEQQGHVAVGRIIDQSYKDYANAQDDKHRELVLDTTELELRLIQDQKFLNPEWVENQIRGLKKGAEAYSVDLADVQADKYIEEHPLTAGEDLRNPRLIPNLTPKQRQDKVEKGDRVSKLKQAEIEQEQKEKVELATRAEMQEIDNLYMDGKLSEAYARLRRSTLIDNKMIIANRISEKAKSLATGVKEDPISSLSLFDKIEQMKPGVYDPKIHQEIYDKAGQMTDAVGRQAISDFWAKVNGHPTVTSDPFWKNIDMEMRFKSGIPMEEGLDNMQSVMARMMEGGAKLATAQYNNILDYFAWRSTFLATATSGKLKGEDLERVGRELAVPVEKRIATRMSGGTVPGDKTFTPGVSTPTPLPPASENKGKTLRDPVTNVRVKSNGKEWIDLTTGKPYLVK